VGGVICSDFSSGPSWDCSSCVVSVGCEDGAIWVNISPVADFRSVKVSCGGTCFVSSGSDSAGSERTDSDPVGSGSAGSSSVGSGNGSVGGVVVSSIVFDGSTSVGFGSREEGASTDIDSVVGFGSFSDFVGSGSDLAGSGSGLVSSLVDGVVGAVGVGGTFSTDTMYGGAVSVGLIDSVGAGL